jgi:hypothetical protein
VIDRFHESHTVLPRITSGGIIENCQGVSLRKSGMNRQFIRCVDTNTARQWDLKFIDVGNPIGRLVLRRRRVLSQCVASRDSHRFKIVNDQIVSSLFRFILWWTWISGWSCTGVASTGPTTATGVRCRSLLLLRLQDKRDGYAITARIIDRGSECRCQPS